MTKTWNDASQVFARKGTPPGFLPQSLPTGPLWESYESALNWIASNRVPAAGVAVTNDDPEPYPEVSGYLVPTLLECGERDLALDLARWLIATQRPDGGWSGPDGRDASYIFDTGQVMRGLLAVVDLLPEAREALRKAADWLLATTDPNGVLRPDPLSAWSKQYGHRIFEDIHLYVLPPLRDTGHLFGDDRYVECVDRSLAYFLDKPDLARFRYLTHFHGYVLEALVDLGCENRARDGLQDAVAQQWPNGAIPAEPDATWVCSPGQAQLAIVGYKLGMFDFADAALSYLQALQTPTGGFRGSYGPGATYGPDSEPSWACKYFLDACHWKIRTEFDRQADRFRVVSDASDARLPVVLAAVGDGSELSILDVGSGRGAALRAVQDRFPTAELWGVDVSPALLAQLPTGIARRRASALNLPFEDATFDVVLCLETLEHVIRTERAIREMCRVLKPNGRIVIVDKSEEYLGRLKIETWERWFDPALVKNYLKDYCDEVNVDPIEALASDPGQAILVAWRGRRNDRPVVPARPLASPRKREESTHGAARYERASRTARARREVAAGFLSYQIGDTRAARNSFVRAIRSDASWLRNRGVVSIIVRSSLASIRQTTSRLLTSLTLRKR